MNQQHHHQHTRVHRLIRVKPVLWLLLMFLVISLAAVYAFWPKTAPLLLTAEEEQFLTQHWQDPLPLQGPAPEKFALLEASLAPASCGTCHPLQYQDWQMSIHSKSMGPGVFGQLIELVESDPATTRLCWSCHTPLAEQQNVLLQANSQGWQQNPFFDASLQQQGLVCAGCHVRNHQRFGPPRSNAPTVTGKINGTLPHGGFTAETAFTKSAFCRGCHQFGADGLALNGKPLENTYQEWKESAYPAKGVHCQTCHMPERRHLWRGIHDPDMVKQGITISVTVPKNTYKKGEILKAIITVANTGVGHYFPTYVTPKVFVRGHLLDSAGNMIADSFQEAIIGREVAIDLSEELYDTRIPPGASSSFSYEQLLPQERMQLKVEVIVAPDHFYERSFGIMLQDGGGGQGRPLLEEALKSTQQSPFTIYEKVIPLFSS